jgi:hypothetical protein
VETPGQGLGETADFSRTPQNFAPRHPPDLGELATVRAVCTPTAARELRAALRRAALRAQASLEAAAAAAGGAATTLTESGDFRALLAHCARKDGWFRRGQTAAAAAEEEEEAEAEAEAAAVSGGWREDEFRARVLEPAIARSLVRRRLSYDGDDDDDTGPSQEDRSAQGRGTPTTAAAAAAGAGTPQRAGRRARARRQMQDDSSSVCRLGVRAQPDNPTDDHCIELVLPPPPLGERDHGHHDCEDGAGAGAGAGRQRPWALPVGFLPRGTAQLLAPLLWSGLIRLEARLRAQDVRHLRDGVNNGGGGALVHHSLAGYPMLLLVYRGPNFHRGLGCATLRSRCGCGVRRVLFGGRFG